MCVCVCVCCHALARRRHKHRPTVKITREMLEELCLKYPQHEAAKVVGKSVRRQQRSSGRVWCNLWCARVCGGGAGVVQLPCAAPLLPAALHQ